MHLLWNKKRLINQRLVEYRDKQLSVKSTSGSLRRPKNLNPEYKVLPISDEHATRRIYRFVGTSRIS